MKKGWWSLEKILPKCLRHLRKFFNKKPIKNEKKCPLKKRTFEKTFCK